VREASVRPRGCIEQTIQEETSGRRIARGGCPRLYRRRPSRHRRVFPECGNAKWFGQSREKIRPERWWHLRERVATSQLRQGCDTPSIQAARTSFNCGCELLATLAPPSTLLVVATG